jgi:hypothetical protein
MNKIIGTIFTAVFVAILNNKIPIEIVKHVSPAAIKAGLPQSSLPALFAAIAKGTPAAMATVPGISPPIELAVSDALLDGYSAAYSYVYYAAIAVGCVGMIACICLKDYDSKLTGHVSRQIYKQGKSDNEIVSPVDYEKHPVEQISLPGETKAVGDPAEVTSESL